MRRFGTVKRVHFVGIGGIGMSGIAELLINLGYDVSGSDIRASKVTERLTQLGARIYNGHRKENVRGADVVVYSSAIKEDNPEIQEARVSYIPVIPRAEMLAELMRLKYGIVVAGSHGKTTTTTMIASVLNSAGMDPTVVIGGRLDIWEGANARLGQGDIMVAESDESDGSFLLLSPAIAVVTNIDREHLNHYGDMDNLRNTFIDFINKVPFYGLAVLCLDNEEIQGIIPSLKKRYRTYGLSSQAEIRAKNINHKGFGSSFEVLYGGESIGSVEVGIPGIHNVLNALATIAVALELNIPMKDIRAGLSNIGGLRRRFQIIGELRGVSLVDDYAHHPTEISATLKTARMCWPDRRIIVVFQPHRFTRTKDLYSRFTKCFHDADILILIPIYPAGETPIEGVTSQWLLKGIKEHGHRNAIFCSDKQEVIDYLKDNIRSGDILITLGAGDVNKIGEEFLRSF